MKKWKKTLKKWSLFALGCVSLLAWGIVTGWWGPTFLCLYFLGSFIMWARRQTVPIQPLIVLLMLPAIDAKIKALEEWNRYAEHHVIAEAKQFEAEILDYNTEEQLFKRGQDATGAKLPGPYSPYTIQIKLATGLPTRWITLYQDGDFHQSYFITWQDTEFKIGADDWKAAKLTREYGPEIFGLDENGIQELIDNLRQPLADNLKKSVAA